MHHPALSAYGRPDAPVRTNRASEYDLFARVTRAITAAVARGATDRPALVRALHDNTKLWRALAIDVADPGNALPASLRAQLFYLFEFTNAHSRKVIEGSASVDVLVEINTAVMRGLRGEGGSL